MMLRVFPMFAVATFAIGLLGATPAAVDLHPRFGATPSPSPTPVALVPVELRARVESRHADEPQMTTLPGETLSTFKGVSTSLAALRAAHAARLSALSSAVALRGATVFKPPAQPVLQNADPYAKLYAADYHAYCDGLNVTVCAYVPADAILEVVPYGNMKFFVGDDPFITDASLCRSGGGTPTTDQNNVNSCSYAYPYAPAVEFQPSTVSSESVVAFDRTFFTPHLDSKGAVAVTVTIAAQTVGPLSAASACTIQVLLP